MRVIVPICAEDTLVTLTTGSNGDSETETKTETEADAKSYNESFSKWDDEEEE